jgi:hypothetical protein
MIIRIVHIISSEQDLKQYCMGLNELYDTGNLNWVIDGNVPDHFDYTSIPYAVDMGTVQNTLRLWRAVDLIVRERGSPLPPGKMILPTIIAMWNRCKGPIDVYSRFLKNAHATHSKLAPSAAVWLRIIMTCVYNAYQAQCLIRSQHYLLSENCTSYTAYQLHRKRAESFSRFCLSLAKNLHLKIANTPDDDVPTQATNDVRVPTSSPTKSATNKKSYKQRDIFFDSESTKSEIRTNQLLRHRTTKIYKNGTNVIKQKRCVWCCATKHHIVETGESHTRVGCKTTWKCTVCDVPLCARERYDRESCFDLFHSSIFLNLPCTKEASERLYMQPQNNKKRPPNRHSSCTFDDNDDDDDEYEYKDDGDDDNHDSEDFYDDEDDLSSDDDDDDSLDSDDHGNNDNRYNDNNNDDGKEEVEEEKQIERNVVRQSRFNHASSKNQIVTRGSL